MKHLPVVQSDEHYAEIYETRKRIADAARAGLEAAIAACGPGADSYARWVITDKLGLLPVRHIYCCRRPELVGWQPDGHFEGWDERIGPEHHPGFEVKDVICRLFRFNTGIEVFTEYRPATPAQLKAAAERRRAEAIAKQEAEEAEERERKAIQPELPL